MVYQKKFFIESIKFALPKEKKNGWFATEQKTFLEKIFNSGINDKNQRAR